MADAYNVRSNGERYYVYRNDGNVQVAEYLGEGAAAKAQRDCAIRNQRHNEQFSPKKKDSSVKENTETESTVGKVQTKPYPVPQIEKKKQSIPNPPPGQGANF